MRKSPPLLVALLRPLKTLICTSVTFLWPFFLRISKFFRTFAPAKVYFMKRNFLLLCLLVAALNAFAYDIDVIITKSREQLQCIILSRTDELITYQLVGDNTQTFTLSTSEVEKIYPRNNGQVISYMPEPEPVNVETKKVETLIAEKPKPIEERKTEPVVEQKEEQKIEQQEPIKEAVKEPEPVVEKPKVVETPKKEAKPAQEKKNIALTDEDLKFKRFMSTINGSDWEQYRAEKAKEAEKKEVLSQNIISIFVTGLDEDQADIQQVIESEALAKLGALQDHKAQIEVASEGFTDDSIIAIAKEHLSKFAFIINVRPFQKQYYMQSKFVDATNGKLLTSASAASSLTSLEDLLKTMDTFTTQVVEHFQKKDEEKKAEEDAELQAWVEESDRQAARTNNAEISFIEDTYTLEIVNPKNYICRVIVAGRLIGMVNPMSTRRFEVSTDLYGKVQIIQHTGYLVLPSEATFYIPEQARRSKITLTMEAF